jgi:hypothetical protein
MAHKKSKNSLHEGCENSQGGVKNQAQSANTIIPPDSRMLVILAIFISYVISMTTLGFKFLKIVLLY